MKRKYISEIKAGDSVFLKGWIYEVRHLAKLKFILLRDSSGIVQCIIKEKKLLDGISDLSLETVVELTGKVKKAHVKAELARNDVEIEVSNINVLNKAEKLPIQVNEKTITTSLPNRLDYRYLDIRKPKIKAIFKIQSTIINAFRDFFSSRGFIEIQPPGIIATSTEGGTNLFSIKYFNREAFLAQSPQLYKQLAAISWEKVFSTSSVWRAEKHDTSKHINEVRQLDIEVAFCDDLEIIKYIEDVLKYIVKKVLEENEEEVNLLGLKGKLKVPQVKYLTYKEAIQVLKKEGFKIKEGDDFEPGAERKLCSLFPNTVIFTYEWPLALKPFYIWPKSRKISGGFDAVYGGVEIASGGKRIHIPEILVKQLKSKKLKPGDFKWYVDAFRFGAPMHAGWSIGLERLTQAICNLNNIREACLFPRDRKRLTP